MGLVSDIFTADVLARLPGSLAIGHTRYSTTGDSALLNAQPIMVECNKGKIALAHNGNITNALEVRAQLEQQGSIFQTTSDTEVIVHLIARSREQTLADAMADSLRRIEGAFSLVMLTPRSHLCRARSARLSSAGHGTHPRTGGARADTIVFASETCAFDLIGATYEREVKPGELVIVGPEGVHSRFYSAQQPQSSCIFEPLPDKKLPILVVLGGLGTGENNIRYITDAGDNAIVGYDWPMPVQFYGGLASLTQISDVYNHVMAIPAQVPSAIRWLSAEPRADRQRISILGFSLGALAAPAIQDVAEHDGQHIGWTILAYGGAPFGELVAANPHIKPGWVRPILASAIDLLLRPLQPTRHLAQLSGQFLVLEGHDNSLIPKDARARLRDAVPAPKTVMELSGDHMGVGQDKVALLQQIIVAGRTWLVERGAVDPL